MKYLYTIYVVLVFVLTFFIQLPFFIIFTRLPKAKAGKLIHRLFLLWCHIFFFLIAITIRIRGRKNIVKGRRYVVVANHQSYLDTPMIYVTLPFFVKTLAREDFGRIPLFGILYKYCTIPVDRSSAASKQQSFQKTIDTIVHDQQDVFIFPEGSFNDTDLLLKPFYSGAFRIAKATGSDILPVIFPDTGKRWNQKGFWEWSPGISRAFILEPITAEEMAEMDIPSLKERVYQDMQVALAAATND